MKKVLAFYEIEWTDAETALGWESKDSVNLPKKITKSYGFFIKQSSNYFTIAADHDEETNNFNRFMHIPKNMIKKKRKIKL